ncbi:OLC1v1035827C1 [Oldenlandia corymbosa var. corymbosa]|uniref:OLC1v1035827C1 n=1 Tax=Oldenlandia corymbosa var. corymbosa TaxID=529605 RepID=A0AAV1CV12_OLDCO|nr:OLC1v1035827C1 [Oldenlandia corymbosa var. corymbosa]
MKERIPPTLFLRHQDGKIWKVRVEKNGSDFYLCGGWENYVRDNSLETGDFLVFQYDGHSFYDITLLGRNGCAKRVVEMDEEEEEETEENVNEADKETQVEVEIEEEEYREPDGEDQSSSTESMESKMSKWSFTFGPT